MVTIEINKEVKLKTPEQDALLAKLLQTSTLTKRERDNIVHRITGKLITSYDASVLITYLLATIKFRKHFSSGRKHKKAECFACGNKLNLKRYVNIPTGKKEWVCDFCLTTLDSSVHAVVPSRKKNGTN